MGQLTLPCILHWNLNHFVVLKRVTRGGKKITICDPAVGERTLSLAEVSRHFTGVALELTPNANFQPEEKQARLRMAQLTGKVRGLWQSLGQIFALALVLELFALAAPLFNQLVVDEVLSAQDRDLLTLLVLGFALLLVTQTAVGLARSWLIMVMGQSISLQWSGNVFTHLVKLPADYFHKRHLGDVMSRFGSVAAMQRTLTTSVVEAMLDGLMAVAALGMMLLYAPTLAGVVVVAVLLYGLLRWVAYAPLRNASAERMVASAKEQSHFIETMRAITPLKLFGREGERRARWQNLLVDVQNRDVRTAKMNIGFSTANTFIFGVENLLVFWLGARLVMGGDIPPDANAANAAFTVGMLFAFISYKGQFTSRVSALINYLVEIRMLGLHAERLADIALAEPEDFSLPDNPLSHLGPRIELRDVSYRYSDGEPWVLKNTTLVIEPGESLAIVGPSGCGKSTLLRVLLGLVPPTEGEVLYGGIPIRLLGLQNYRRQIGSVMQEDLLLSGSIADNITFFDVASDQEQVEHCARLAAVHEDIARMPMGYQTLVGDMGSSLSGGQKQRVLLARALYKQPRVLALDEATSHLDLPNERLVTQALAALEVTRVIVAHRPDTIAGAQRVMRLQGGQLVELRSMEAAQA